ncbi:MAG: c-type cytochrome [Sulfurospirillaceae bacterium]|jgi:cytochrome c oxidase cbb3-type subunit 3|nr:c-type cytochrome [Sulfurospirillaceae bacterium]MCK9546349.1 c-type cytochrome [Sulfurospirillaceae bacterium]MDY0237368.1 c-type cytochrome [Campylobacterales bacterium]NLN00218.1 cytochrome C oxidase Cbb3 [Campylobacteraceae bacterium]
MEWFNLSDNVNLLSIIGAATIIIATVLVAGKYIKQIKDDKSEGELYEDSQDGIGKYKNPVPMGWAVVFLLLIAWAVWYMLYGYPVNAYSQIGEYNEEVENYNKKFESKWADPSKGTLLAMGEGIYLVQCAPCHGITADGMDNKAADLTVWGKKEGIVDAIVNGSSGLDYPFGEMPAGMLDEDSAKAVAAYIVKEISKTSTSEDEAQVAMGEALFATCAACHGDDGKGMMGQTPDLSIYGKSEFVKEVLERGKNGDIGMMPAFKDGRLSDIQKEAVGTYILSL